MVHGYKTSFHREGLKLELHRELGREFRYEREKINRFVDQLAEVDGNDPDQVEAYCEIKPNAEDQYCTTDGFQNRNRFYINAALQGLNLTLDQKNRLTDLTLKSMAAPAMWRAYHFQNKEGPLYVNDRSIYTNPEATRSEVRELKESFKTNAQNRSLEELGLDSKSELGKFLVDASSRYLEQGLEGLIQHFKTLPNKEIKTRVQALLTQAPIRLKLTYDQHFPLRFKLSMELNHQSRLLYHEDPVSRWKVQPYQDRQLSETSFVEPVKKEGRELFSTLRESGRFKEFQTTSDSLGRDYEFNTEEIAKAYSSPEALSLLVEGVLRVQQMNKAIPTAHEKQGEGSGKSVYHVEYRGHGWRKHQISIPSYQDGQGTSLHPSNETQGILGKVLSVIHQILPKEYALKKVRMSPMGGSQMNRTADFYGLIFARPAYQLLIGDQKNITEQEQAATLTHEMGHYLYYRLVDRKCDKNLTVTCTEGDPFEDDTRAEKLLKGLNEIYNEAIKADAALILADSQYLDTFIGNGHSWENDNEFFASAVMIFLLYGDELAENIQRDSTPEPVKKYAREMWCFLRDNFFHTVFTENGEDPFANPVG